MFTIFHKVTKTTYSALSAVLKRRPTLPCQLSPGDPAGVATLARSDPTHNDQAVLSVLCNNL